ncbi:MAG: regulatory protein RecX [Bacteroidota bacterium]
MFSEETAALLPAPLSKIEVQKRNTTRVSLFIENQFLIGIDLLLFEESGIRVGNLVTENDLKLLVSKEYRNRTKDYLLGLLSRRDHTKTELRKKAAKKGFPAALVQDAIAELNEKGYIDEARFANHFASDSFRLKKWGLHKIRFELRKKGVSETDIKQALQDLHEDTDTQIDMMLRLVERKKTFLMKEQDPWKRKKKVFDFLVRKGYDSVLIQKQLDRLLALIHL